MLIKIEIRASNAIPIIEKYISEHFQFPYSDGDQERVWTGEDVDGETVYYALVLTSEIGNAK